MATATNEAKPLDRVRQILDEMDAEEKSDAQERQALLERQRAIDVREAGRAEKTRLAILDVRKAGRAEKTRLAILDVLKGGSNGYLPHAQPRSPAKPTQKPKSPVLTLAQLGMTSEQMFGLVCLASIKDSGLIRGTINLDARFDGIEAGFYVVVDVEGYETPSETYTMRHLTEQQYWKGEERPWKKGRIKVEPGLLLGDKEGLSWVVDGCEPVIVRARGEGA